MDGKREESSYRTYLLRLWREQAAIPQCQPVWRCSIEDTTTHNRRGFGSVEDLATHLCALAEGAGRDTHADPADAPSRRGER